MPGCRVVYVRHPVQLLSANELAAVAEAAFPGVLEALTTGAAPDVAPFGATT